MEDKSPFLLMKSLETELNVRLRTIDVAALGKPQQKLVDMLRRDIVDARLDIRDYELSETRDEQLGKAKDAKQRLEQMRKGILAASEDDIFGSVEVAQLSAELEQIIELLI